MGRIASLLWPLLLLSAGSLAPAAAQPQQPQKWVEYKPQGAGYRVEFPEPPKQSQDEISTGAGPVRMQVAQFGGDADIVYIAIYSDYPVGALPTEPQAALDAARDASVKNVNGILREDKKITVGDKPARRLLIDIPEGRRIGAALIVLDGNRLYRAVCVAPAGQENSVDLKKFLDSFALVKR
jgi:hypothetical protein